MSGLFFKSGISDDYEKDLARMNKQLNKFAKNNAQKGAEIDSTFKKIGSTVATSLSFAALIAAGKNMTNFTRELETALTEVATISTEVTDNFDEYRNELLALSTDSDVTAVALTNAFYDIVSASYDGAEGLKLLAAAERASTAGFVDVGVAADGLTTVLNAWGKSADEAANVSDVFFKTVEKGKTTFPELGSNIAQVAPIAASMGISFEEVSGALATLTKSGTPTSQAFTQIRSAILAMTDVLGDGWARTMTFQEGVVAVREAAGGSDIKLKDMLGRVEAVNAVLGLTGKNAEVAASDLEAMNQALGATAIAAAKVESTTDYQIKKLKNNILAAFQPLSTTATAIIADLLKKLNHAFETGNAQKFIKVVGTLLKAFAAYKVSVIALNQVQKIQNAMTLSTVKAMRLSAQTGKAVSGANIMMAKSMKAVKAAFMSNPIGLIATALVAALPLIQKFAASLDRSENKLKKINDEINKTYTEESAGLQVIKAQLDDVNISQDKRNSLIEELNKKYGEYLPYLLDEKSTQEDISKAIDAANIALREQIRLKVLNQKAEETQAKILELQEKYEKASSNILARDAENIAEKALQATSFAYTGFFKGRAALIKKNLKEEQEAYDAILEQLVNSTIDANNQITKVVEDDEPDIITNEEAAILELEIAYQKRTNLLKSQLSKELLTQDEFAEASLKSQISYLRNLQKVTSDELDKLKIGEQILDAQANLDLITEKGKLKEMLKDFATYTTQREEIQKKYNTKIEALVKAGYDNEAQMARDALDKELDDLDNAILKGSVKFQKWTEDVLPGIAKKGVEALKAEIEKIEIDITTENMDPKSVLILKEKVSLLKKEIEKIEGKQKDVNKKWEDSVDLMNNFNELINTTVGSLENVDDVTKTIISSITEMVSGVINIGTALESAKKTMTGLEKASVVLVAITTALKILDSVNTAINAAQEQRSAAANRELSQIHAINAALIEQNRLYEEGNSYFSEDAWGTALKGLEAYNQALVIQEDYLEALSTSSQKLTDTSSNKFLFGLAGAGKLISEQAAQQQINDLQNQASSYATTLEQALANVVVKTKDRSSVANWLGLSDDYNNILNLYPDLISATGELDTEILQLVIDNEDLTDSDQTRLQNLLDLTEQMKDAYSQFGDYISSIFSSVGDDITQAFQDMYADGTDAMESLQTSFSSMIESFTQDAIQYAYLQPYLNELNEMTQQLGEQYAAGNITADQLQKNIISTLGDFYNSMNELQPEILQAYENADKLAAEAGFDAAFNPEAVDTSEDASTIEVDTIEADTTEDESVSGQISDTITEETGSIISGRLGAIMLSNERIANYSQEALDYAVQNLVYLNQIKMNTDYLPQIADNTRKMYESLENV